VLFGFGVAILQQRKAPSEMQGICLSQSITAAVGDLAVHGLSAQNKIREKPIVL
jgi:hypothetical protein